ncbi:MAG: hypothetical protein V1778_03615 [bacterium]
MTLYRDIISKALILAWRHKYLWVFAFFAALAGNGGELELAYSGSDSVNGQSYILGILRAFYQNGSLSQIMQNIRDFFGRYPLPSIFLVLLLLLLAVLLIWIVIVAQAALFWAIARIQEKRAVSFQESFSTGARFFSPIFLLNLIAKVIILGVIFLIAFPLGLQYIRSGATLYNGLYILTVFLALVPISIIISFIVKYASIYVVLRGQTWRAAFKNSWALFFKNWLVSIEVAFVLFIINLVTSLLLSFLLLLLGLITNPAGAILFFLIIMIYGALLATFQYTTWVNLFFALEGGTARSKILRWVDRLTKKTPTQPVPTK